MDEQAERLYNAVMATLKANGMRGLLAAAGDAQAKVPWAQASHKTRELFHLLAANLTDKPRTA